MLSGGQGADVFVTRELDGGETVETADIILDFSDGTDLIGLSGLTFAELTISQGTGDNANHSVVQVTATGEYLFVVQDITAGMLTEDDFIDNYI